MTSTQTDWHMTSTPLAQNYWSSGEPPLPHYACIYHPSEISSFTVVENVFTLTVRVLIQTAEFLFEFWLISFADFWTLWPYFWNTPRTWEVIKFLQNFIKLYVPWNFTRSFQKFNVKCTPNFVHVHSEELE